MTSGQDWSGRVGDVWAAEWQRTDRSFADLAPHLNAAIAAVAPHRGKALDIGCGAGATGLALHGARPDLDIIGVDLSAGLVGVARRRAADREAVAGEGSLSFQFDDALALAAREAPFDLFLSRHGVMFFSDPVAAFAALRRAASDSATLIFSCFDARGHNGFATLADAITGQVPVSSDAYQPGPFAFADSHAVADWLEQAGWTPGAAARISFDYVIGQGDAPLADAVEFLSRIGPAARAIGDAPPEERARITTALEQALGDYRIEDRIALPASAWIWRAHAGADRT
jgi:2-polyprenyl-3-methyl-5-hydroxy-6-metoxy-1,4-benzoquinol methylase